MTQKTKPMPFQKIGIFELDHCHKGRGLLADDVGLGKSLQSIYASIPYRRKRPIIIVCPNPVKYGWEIEVKKHTNFNCWVLEGLKPPKKLPLDVPQVIILNWEILKAWWKVLKTLNPSVVIGDEIHYIKTRSTIRTKAFRRLCKGVEHMYFLSGTPIENCPAEFFVPLNILRPDLFPSFRPYGDRYCGPVYTPWGVQYKGATRMKELNRILRKELMVRRTKEEVLKDLPPIRRDVIPLKVDLKEYKEAERDIVAWLFRHKPSKARSVGNAVHLAKLSHLLSLVADLKMKQVCDWIDNFLESNPTKKLTVFGHHRKFLETLHERYKDKSVLVYGGMGAKKKQKTIDAFADDKKIRVFIGSIMATGTGINKLQTVCSDLVIAELVWVGLKLLQVEGRLHRLGQKNKVTAYYLIVKGTVEEILCKAIHRKQAIINKVVDGDYKRQEFKIFEKVIRTLTKKRKRKAA